MGWIADVELCEGRIGRFGAVVGKVLPTGKEHRVGAFVTICEGQRPRFQQRHKFSVRNRTNLLQKYALKR